MQNLNILEPDSLAQSLNLDFQPQMSTFSSTKLKLKQRYMQDFLKDLKKSDVSKSSNTETKPSKEVLFEEIKGLLSDF